MKSKSTGLAADILRRNLRTVLQAYCPDESSWWKIGIAAMNQRKQPKYILSEDQPFYVPTYDRLMLFFSANWPAGVEWPVDVPRPVVKKRRGGA